MVLVGAHLDSWAHGPGVVDNNCDAAMVIEAARDILRTGIRRAVRFASFYSLAMRRACPGPGPTCARTARSSIALALLSFSIPDAAG